MSTPTQSGSVQRRFHDVIITTPFYVPAYLGGGPIQTLKALVNAAPSEFKLHVVCGNHDLGESTPLTEHPNQWVEVGPARVQYVEGGIWSQIKALKQTEGAEIVYLNSLFNPQYSLLPMLLKRFGFWENGTILIAPRGELDPGALALKSRKKKTFITIFKLLRFHKLALWHASSKLEASQIRTQFGAVSVLVRENETSLPQLAVNRPPRKVGPARLLFVSRLDQKKGLHILLESLQSITQPVELKIVGAFEDSEYETRCRRLLEQLGQNVSVDFCGPLKRDEVLAKMHSADLLAFPTAGENFGHVIAEALSQSCPVMCSTNTPWTNRLKNGGGAVVQSNMPGTWSMELQDFLTSGPQSWEKAALSAGQSFTAWRNEDKGTHVFTLASNHFHQQG